MGKGNGRCEEVLGEVCGVWKSVGRGVGSVLGCGEVLRNRLQNKSPEEFQGLTSKASDVSTKLKIS